MLGSVSFSSVDFSNLDFDGISKYFWSAGPISELKQNMEISETCEVEHFFFYRLPNNYKRYVFGINSHLDESIEGGS